MNNDDKTNAAVQSTGLAGVAGSVFEIYEIRKGKDCATGKRYDSFDEADIDCSALNENPQAHFFIKEIAPNQNDEL